MPQVLPVTELGPFGEVLDVIPWVTITDTAVSFPNDGRTAFFARSKNSAAQTVVLSSVVSPFGRSGDKTISLAAGNTDPQVGMSGFLPRHLWNDNGGDVNATYSVTADMEGAAIRLRTS